MKNQSVQRILGLLAAFGASVALQAATHQVEISGFAFNPASLTINVGDTVTWTQRDTTAHTTTSSTGVWSSPFLSVGQTFSFTFTTAGTFNYFCSPHPFMTGSITVNAAANTAPTVVLAAPSSGATFFAPANITLTATATDADGTIAKVEFFLGTSLLGSATASPYSVVWSNVPSGGFTLTAKATDNRGATTTSAAVSITVNEPSPIQMGKISMSGNAVALAWTGGAGPYMVQRKSSLADANWSNMQNTSLQSLMMPREADTAFYRVVDRPATSASTFTAFLSGLSERPTALTNSASGFAVFTLEGTNVAFRINLANLSGPPTAGHFHGPTNSSSAAGVAKGFGSLGTNATGTVTGSVSLTEAQVTALKAGQLYANVHTSANGGGEIRGQVGPILLQADLNGGNENPPVTTPGTGKGYFSLIGNQLWYDITYSGLKAAATAGHIHGPAPTTTNAPVLIGFTGVTGTSNNIKGLLTLTPDQIGYVVDGRTYANIHTSAHGGGEIRGQILP